MLYKEIENVTKDLVSFHVPGHKSGKLLDKYKNFKDKIINIDTTEIEGTDNLHDCEGIIKEASNRASKVFKSDNTFLLVNGSTCGIYAMIMTITNPGDKLIVARDCHQSVINACILGDVEPIYVCPKIDDYLGISKGVSYEDIKKAISLNRDAKGVILTSPNYFGITCDIQKISDLLKESDKYLLVDEAHGAHLGLSNLLPRPALSQGADMVVQSTHKTLPSFTQSSMLHTRGNKVNIEKLKSILRMVQSSSPSYILMSSLDMATKIYEEEGKYLMSNLINYILDLKDFAKKLDNIKIFESQDITKVYIITKDLKRSGYEIEQMLRDRYNIQVELSNLCGVLLVCSIGNDKEDFERLKKALSEIDKFIGKESIIMPSYKNINPVKVLNPRKAFYLPKTKIKIRQSIGKISGEYIIPYPPGIPVISPGEKISEDIINYILSTKKLGMKITGIKDSNLDYIEIID
ncbi:aminotransferase class I/II-fold pyridoxal phosphate-dependent enzyme [Alkalithermobacter paradoxus]|uniref:Arginine decarboxylase n=1 Tax=Alkalithermobacter paradoxus TaxID=29349 RepID=A0A1V4I569_9FIRM|nr:arginine decarboxylase [[Clostridium] thermoalcaliphilum]